MESKLDDLELFLNKTNMVGPVYNYLIHFERLSVSVLIDRIEIEAKDFKLTVVGGSVTLSTIDNDLKEKEHTFTYKKPASELFYDL